MIRWKIVKISKNKKVNKGCSTTSWQNFENIKKKNGLFHNPNHPRKYESSNSTFNKARDTLETIGAQDTQRTIK